PQTELDHTRKVVLTGDLAKSSRAHGIQRSLPPIRVWRTELRVVEEVEKLGTKLDADSPIRAKLRVFEGSKIDIFDTICTNIRLRTRVITITVVISVHKHR